METVCSASGSFWLELLRVEESSWIAQPSRYITPECLVELDIALKTKERIKLDFCVYWKSIGNDSEVSSEKERIYHYISKLPSEDFLQDIRTLEQLREWVNLKNFSLQLTKCWQVFGSSEDPLYRDFERGWIDWWLHDHIWLEVALYENLWQLICHKGEDIKAIFNQMRFHQSLSSPDEQTAALRKSKISCSKLPKKLRRYLLQEQYSFSSTCELLQEIVKQMIDEQFSNYLKPHYIENAKDFKKIATLTRHDCKAKGLSMKEREEQYSLVEKHRSPSCIFLLERVLGACQITAFGDF